MSDKCQPFFQCIKKNVSVVWGDEKNKVIDELKSYLSTPLILSAPIKDEPFFLYLATLEVALIAVLFIEKEEKQKPIF